MRLEEESRRLTGRVEIDDAYLGGERSGGKNGRGAENKEPFIAAVQTGDGAFGFNAMEIDTAARHKARLLIVVANNGSWAIEVRDQQETHGKVVGTRLQFADHAAMARAVGLHAERVERAEDHPAAIDRALAPLAQGRPPCSMCW